MNKAARKLRADIRYHFRYELRDDAPVLDKLLLGLSAALEEERDTADRTNEFSQFCADHYHSAWDRFAEYKKKHPGKYIAAAIRRLR